MALKLWLVLLGRCRKQGTELVGCRRKMVVEVEQLGEVVAWLRVREQEVGGDRVELVGEGCKQGAAEVLLVVDVHQEPQEDLQRHNHQGSNAEHIERYYLVLGSQ